MLHGGFQPVPPGPATACNLLNSRKQKFPSQHGHLAGHRWRFGACVGRAVASEEKAAFFLLTRHRCKTAQFGPRARCSRSDGSRQLAVSICSVSSSKLTKASSAKSVSILLRFSVLRQGLKNHESVTRAEQLGKQKESVVLGKTKVRVPPLA